MSDSSFNVSPTLRSFILKSSDFKKGKLIGQGNSGKVYLAIHIPTGKICSFKELFMEQLSGKNMIFFSREIEILVKCDNMFVLPFYGWTSEYPYSIITEYIPNGSLFHSLQHRPTSPNLTSTNKTLIAIGIANGMMSLHSVGIIHRDLKPLNILLDEKLLPKICDFGLSRFTNEELNLMSLEIGTPRWMAPETFDSKNYTNKVDVYSYGILLWEMLTEDIPFQGLTPIQIAYKVTKDNERPEFPSNTPRPLKSLIRKCWDRNPDNRPTFSQIYHFLLRKGAFFTGTDLNAIDNLVIEIKNQELQRSKQSNSRISPLLPSKDTGFTISSNSIKSPRSERYKENDNSDGKSKFNNIPHPNSTEFRAAFTDCLNYLTKDNYAQFNKVLSNLFMIKNINEGSLILILLELLKLVSNQRYLIRFINDELYKKIPLDDRKITCLSLQILLQVTTQHPEIIDMNFLKLLNPILSVYPSRILRIISPIFLQFGKNSKAFEISDFLLKNPKPFLLYSGKEYLTTLFFLCRNSPTFFRARFEYVINILCIAILSHDVQTIVADYSMICFFFDERIALPIAAVTNHLNYDDTRDYALSYLIRKSHIELTTNLVSTLLKVSPSSKLASQLLCKYLTGSMQTRQYLVIDYPNWMEDDRLPINISIPYTLIIESDFKLRKYLAEATQFLSLLKRILKSSNPEFNSIACGMITKLMPNAKLIEKLINMRYFSKFIEMLRKFDEQQESLIIHNVIGLIDDCSRSAFVSDFLSLIPKLIKLILEPKYSISSLSALCSLSNYSKAISSMKKYNIEDTLNKIQQNKDNQNHIDLLRQNLTK